MCSRKVSTTLHRRLVVEALLIVREVLQVVENGDFEIINNNNININNSNNNIFLV